MNYVVMLCFTEPHVVKKSILQFKETIGLDESEYKFIMLDQNYPLPSKSENACQLAELANVFNAHLLRPYKNLGLHEGANWVCKQVELGDADNYIGVDHDCWPTIAGWGQSLVRVLADDSISHASLWNIGSKDCPGREWTPSMINDVPVLEAKQFAVNGITGYKGSFLNKCGGFSEMCKFYGHLEMAMWYKAKDLGLRMVYLQQYWDDLHMTAGHHELLTKYKWDHAHSRIWEGDFESWLKDKGHL